jgi:uncharacterized protein (TIGR03382 family)
MLSTFASLVLAASVFTPQLSQQLVTPTTGAPKLEVGVLSAPLPGELTAAVRAWALSQRQHYGLPAAASLNSIEAFSTRFGASFHLQQTVNGLEVYQAKLVVTLDDKRQVVQVSSSLVPFTRVLDGDALSFEQVMQRAAASLPLVGLRPDGVPYGGARAFYFQVGEELHKGYVANVQSLDMTKNWYVAIDAVNGERLFQQNRVHHAALDAKVYPLSPGGLDAGVGTVPTVTRELRHADGGSMISDTCVNLQADGGFASYTNDAGELCGTQLMMYNCCPSEGCAPDAGPRRVAGSLVFMGIPVQYDVAMCDRVRRASNVTNGTLDYAYEPVDPPTNRTAVVASDLANSDQFAEVHSFYHVNTVYDWMRRLSTRAQPIFGSNPAILPFRMRDEKRTPAVKVSVWSNVMFPNFNEIFAGVPGCLPPPIGTPPCRANTLTRLDNAAFFPRENFSQIPLPGFDTGSDTLMIFQGNSADAAYDATVIQHEFGHGAVYATAALTFDDTAIDQRSANNEGGALHEAFADYIAAAFNNVPEVGPYFGPRVTAGQPTAPGVRSDAYLRSMDNTQACPDVLWGQVHQDSVHVAGALWEARKNVFQGTDSGDTFDAAFYAMLVSITPNADFGLVATAMAARVATAFPGIPTASMQMTQIFQGRGVLGCSKVLTVGASTFPRMYYGIAAAPPALGSAVIPGPVQFKIPAAAGALRVRLTASAGQSGGIGGGAAPVVRILTKNGSPITFVRQGGSLQNDATVAVDAAVTMAGAVTGTANVNAPCNTDVYVTLASPGDGATLQNVTLAVDPLVNCMVPVDGGTGGGAGGGGGATGGGSGGGNTSTTTLPSVGPGSTTEQPTAKVGCGCSGPADFAAPLFGLMVLLSRRRRRS